MLRCPWLPGVQVLLFAVGTVVVAVAAADAEPPAPRTLMRLPGWIESFGEQPMEPDAATPDATPVTPAVGDDGSPAAPWTDLVPVAAADDPQAARSPATTPPKPPLGPESSVLKRWISDRVAQLPKPTAIAAKPVEQPATPAPSATAAAEEPSASKVTAPVAATPDEMPTLSIDPASFRGVHPGRTRRAELLAAWGAGEPLDRVDEGAGFAWKIEPFERVEVTLQDDTVAAILVKLAEPVTVAELTRQLEIADVRTVTIFDDQGVAIGTVYPERGVILSLKPGTQVANAIMIEPLDPESFVLRAEGELGTCSAYAVADLQYAIEIDPRHVRAHRLLLGIASDQGRWAQALKLAETAAALDPADAWTQLKHAGALLALDRPGEARAILDALRSRENSSPLV
ncbi:MAG: tetratricopeptide repeat protein, partial [Planctomycetia bacterium]